MNYTRGCCEQMAPCKCQPMVMPVQECIVNRCYYVEQPVIIPCQTRVVNHYVPRPTYYYSYNQVEENVCHNNETKR